MNQTDTKLTGGKLAARWEAKVQHGAHPLLYPALRAVPGPVLRVPGLGVLISDAELIRAALIQPETFAKNGPGTSSDLWTPVLGEKVLLNMSGEEHRVMRRKLAPLFTPGFVDVLSRNSLTVPLAELRERLGSGAAVDLVQQAHLLSSVVISQLIGLPAQQIHNDRLYQQIHRISGTLGLRKLSLDQEQTALARRIMAELTGQAALAYRRGDPDTVPGRMRELGLSEEEALGAVGAFALTGTETLTAYLPRLIALLIDSGWLNRLSADRSLLEPAIAEGLRVTTPVLVMLRRVRQPATLGKHRFRPGERLILLGFRVTQAAGRFDPEANPAAALKQLWFGAGAHFCLGAPLAMAQIRLVLETLLDVAESTPLRIHHRQPAKHVLIPAYRELVLGR